MFSIKKSIGSASGYPLLGVSAFLVFASTALLSALAGEARADVLYGIQGITGSCGWDAQYNQPSNANGGVNGLDPNSPGPCNVSGSATLTPGLTAASGQILAVGNQNPSAVTTSGSWAADLSNASLHATSSTSGNANSGNTRPTLASETP